MGGGLLQLVAYGAQDIHLTGNPQITFFKVVYRRHTNFSIESIKQTFNGTADFGQEVSTNIQRNGDLIYKMYLQTTLPEVNLSSGLTANTNIYRAFRWVNWVGHVLLKNVEVRIGGQKIDKHYGEWLHIWNELSQTAEKASGYAEMVGNVPKLTQIYSTNSNTECIVNSYSLYIPLQFWFCRNPGMALPLIALQYSDINVNIEFRSLNECIWATQQNSGSHEATPSYTDNTGSNALGSQTLNLSSSNLYVDYIYLDTDERRRFAEVSHEYLIEQLQFTGEETISNTSNQIRLNFTHPVKELIWVIQPTNYTTLDYSQSRAGRQYYNYTDLWDYSNFTGTPQSKNGTGMIGGRNNHNLNFGYSTVLADGDLSSTNQWASSLLNNTKETSGYNDVSFYTKQNSINVFSTRSGIWSTSNNSVVDDGDNTLSTAKLILNGNDRFSEREGKYFNLVQTYQHHTNCPAPGINVYSFALTPEDHQPSGSCNFSRIDNAFLNVVVTPNTISSIYNSGSAKIRIYAISYNILKIKSGMGGLAYSN